MKIKHVKVQIGKGYTWVTFWLMLPDFYTFWMGLGITDKEYLIKCWDNKELQKIDEFMEVHRLNLCRGSIIFGARQEATRHKKFSWTWFRKRIYGAWTELNTPLPKHNSPNEKTREVPISRTNRFLTLLKIPTRIPIPQLKDYITLLILNRDYGKYLR